MLIAIVIGFKNSFETVMEGGMKSVCAVIKPDGLILDPFDRVPLIIRTDPGKVHARILSQPVLWVIHTNKCGSIQLLGQCIVPYEIYHPINCIHCLLYFM